MLKEIVKKQEEIIDMLLYAPGMPGYIEGLKSWEQREKL